MTCFEGAQQFHGGWVWGVLSVEEGPRLAHLFTEEPQEWCCWSRAEPGGPPWWQHCRWKRYHWAQVRGHHWAEASTRQSTSVRTEAHLTRKSSEVAHGVLSRIIKKKRSYFSHYFWKYCMSKLKSKVHLRVIGGDTHTHLHIHTHTHHSSLKVKWFINKNPSCIGVFSSTGIFPHCEGFQSGPYLIRHSRQYKENNVKKKSRANPS